MPWDNPALLEMPDIEVPDILKIMCKVMGDPDKSRNSQTMKAAKGSSFKAHKV